MQIMTVKPEPVEAEVIIRLSQREATLLKHLTGCVDIDEHCSYRADVKELKEKLFDRLDAAKVSVVLATERSVSEAKE